MESQVRRVGLLALWTKEISLPLILTHPGEWNWYKRAENREDRGAEGPLKLLDHTPPL